MTKTGHWMSIARAARNLGWATAAGLLALMSPALACSADTDCGIDAGGTRGDYRIRMPAADNDDPPGAIIYLHGWQGSPDEIMRFKALNAVAEELGVALLAPRGLGKSWSFPRTGRTPQRDDVAFIEAVVDDAVERFRLDRDRVMISGFSVGSSMAWYVACEAGTNYAGYATIAGAFWMPYPESCVRPAPNLFHVHGTTDGTVPMVGRALGNGARQGEVSISFGLLLDTPPITIDTSVVEPGDQSRLSCRRMDADGNAQELCLHGGGHSVRPEWIRRAWLELAAAKHWE